MSRIFAMVHKGCADDVKSALLECAEDIDAQDGDGRTPLIQASINNNEPVVRVLLEAGAQVNVSDAIGGTALHYAAQASSLSIIKLLVANNAEVDAQDIHGNTPLWKAVFNSRGDHRSVGFLLSVGADRNKKNKNGKTPFDLASSIANFDIKSAFE